jgi:Flp pilus assembly protein TadD
VATRLEQFRAFFRRTFPNLKFDSTVPLRVVIFKDVASYSPFKPVRLDGTTDALVTGSFHAGADVNYITFSLADDSSESYNTILHEYTHFLLNNNLERSNLEPWLNEGLAEYYENFRIENEQKAVTGMIPPTSLRLLQQEKLIPLETFFKTDNYTLHNQGNHGRSLFYAQSWALMHYLHHGGRREQTAKFFELLFSGKSSREAFQSAFQIDLPTFEKEFQNYVKQPSFQTVSYTLQPKPTFDNEVKSSFLTEAETQTILGDLLLHSNRLDEAVTKLEKAVSLNDKLATANALLGTVLMRQRKFSEAEKHLEKAIRLDNRNYLTHYYYAYALSREDLDPFGFVKAYAGQKTKKMRELLKRTVELKPDFAEAYHLLGFINLINNENLNEAAELVEKALALEPGNQSFLLDLAQIRLQQTDYQTAEQLAEKVFVSTADRDLRLNAQSVLISTRSIQEKLKQIEEDYKRGVKNGTEYPVMTQEEGFLLALNEAIRKPQNGEQRILGYLMQINCSPNENTFVIRPQNASNNQTSNETFKFTSDEMQKVKMIAFSPGIEGKQMGCGIKKPEIFVVATYRPSTDAKAKSDGEIISLEFVPSVFRFLP